MYDVAIIGAGIAGMATAARLQAKGLSTLVLEAHWQPGGCAGYYRRKGFAFDVGATTLVDFEPGGVGGELLDSVGSPPLLGEALPGYVAWLPDRIVTLYRDHNHWLAERSSTLGNTPSHHAFWNLLDRLAQVFWQASRRGARLPIRVIGDIAVNAAAIGAINLPYTRYLNWTIGDALRHFGLENDRSLTALLAMLIQDTVHSTINEAPLINAALGITIRGAGLSRHAGGMYGFWQRFVAHYRKLGGELRVGCRVACIEGSVGSFSIHSKRGKFRAAHVVCAVPTPIAAQIAPLPVARALRPYLERDSDALGGAIVVFLGVPESEVAHQTFTHHQLMHNYSQPLGNGNNMFISVSAPGDTLSAPPGYRAVMLSTHCELDAWQDLSDAEYAVQKQKIGDHLVELARRIYPNLGCQPCVYEIGTPRTYEKYTGRPGGAVGGIRQTLDNANQHAVPHNVGLPGFWLVGDSTWPGLGTVACVLGSRIVAEEVLCLIHRNGIRR